MTAADLRAKAESLTVELLCACRYRTLNPNDKYAGEQLQEEIDALAAFITALMACAEQLQLTANVGQQLAPIFDEVKYPEPHKTLRNQLAALSRLEELTK